MADDYSLNDAVRDLLPPEAAPLLDALSQRTSPDRVLLEFTSYREPGPVLVAHDLIVSVAPVPSGTLVTTSVTTALGTQQFIVTESPAKVRDLIRAAFDYGLDGRAGMEGTDE